MDMPWYVYLVCVYALRSMSTKNIGKTTQMFVFASETKSMKHLIRSDITIDCLCSCAQLNSRTTSKAHAVWQ